MRRVEIAIFAVAVIGRGIAQNPPNVSKEIGNALAAEWKDLVLYPDLDFNTGNVSAGQVAGVMHCLQALDRYTALLPSQSDSEKALRELKLATPSRAQTFLDWAKDLGIDVSTSLADASTLSIDKNNAKATVPLFAKVAAGVKLAYQNDNAVVRLKENVNKEVTVKNYPRALYELLALTFEDRAMLYPAPAFTPAQATQNALVLMEEYRTCYALDPDKLFKLVSDSLK